LITPTEEGFSPALADAVQAAQEVPAAAVDTAQTRLSCALQARSRREQPAMRGWLTGGLAAMAIVVLAIGLPLLSEQGDAFAAVQAHFRQFRTLQMDVTQRHGGEVMQTSRTRVDASGATRTDIGESLSVVVDPRRGRVLTLLHEERQAVVATLTPQAAKGSDLAWLAKLRRFNGKAVPLAGTRTIASQSARGWLVDLGGDAIELWADADALPLEMRTRGGGVQIDYRFVFDTEFAPGLFDVAVPVGYVQVDADGD